MATYTGSPRTWSAGEEITTALLNSEVRAPMLALAGERTSYSPTLTQGVTVTYTGAIRYMQVGKTVIADGRLRPTSSGTSGQNIYLTMPVTAGSSYSTGRIACGPANVSTNLGTPYTLMAAFLTSTTLAFRRCDADCSSWFGASPSLQVVNNFYIGFSVIYEAA